MIFIKPRTNQSKLPNMQHAIEIFEFHIEIHDFLKENKLELPQQTTYNKISLALFQDQPSLLKGCSFDDLLNFSYTIPNQWE